MLFTHYHYSLPFARKENNGKQQRTISTVTATPRTGKFNKNHARRVRREGLIPAVVYGAGGPSVAVAVDPKIITRILHSDSGHNTIFDLAIEGGATGKAMIVDWQNEPIKGHLLHIDLKRIAMDKKMQRLRPRDTHRHRSRRQELRRHPAATLCTRSRSSASPATSHRTSTSTSPTSR